MRHKGKAIGARTLNPCEKDQLVSIHKWPFFASSASICGVSCAEYYVYTSAQLLDFLDLAKNCSFLNWKLHSAQVRVCGRAPIRSYGHSPVLLC
jgi:hypothetical protein